MNEIVNKLLLVEKEFMPKMHLREPGFTVLVNHSLKTKKEYKNLKEQEIQDTFIKRN